MELRYRLADAVNDGLKAIPGLHPLIKRTALLLRRMKGNPVNYEPHAGAAGQSPSNTSSWLPTAKKLAATTEIPVGTGGQQPESTKGDCHVPHTAQSAELPIPPLEMRELVGPTELSWFDNSDGRLVFPELPDPKVYREVFDFGCGCGRLARQLIQQRPRPQRYLGIDLHRGMIQWCQKNLQPAAPNFEFLHHDVANVFFNPGECKPRMAPFPASDGEFTLVTALSVFTHLTEDQTKHYLAECARVLGPDGILVATWFLFDKADFPMMQEWDNALYMQYLDPSAAVMYDRAWVRQTARALGFTIFGLTAPTVRGFQWLLLMTRKPDAVELKLPPDRAPRGAVRLDRGIPRKAPAAIGLEP